MVNLVWVGGAGKGEKTNFIANYVALVMEDNQKKITPQQFPKSKKTRNLFSRIYSLLRFPVDFYLVVARETTGDTVRREGCIWRISL